jgi:hypothetical protein
VVVCNAVVEWISEDALSGVGGHWPAQRTPQQHEHVHYSSKHTELGVRLLSRHGVRLDLQQARGVGVAEVTLPPCRSRMSCNAASTARPCRSPSPRRGGAVAWEERSLWRRTPMTDNLSLAVALVRSAYTQAKETKRRACLILDEIRNTRHTLAELVRARLHLLASWTPGSLSLVNTSRGRPSKYIGSFLQNKPTATLCHYHTGPCCHVTQYVTPPAEI